MESNYNNRDFEQFIKQNADQYRMFPSEKVWNGIDKALHTRRRWYGLGLAFLLLLTGAGVTWVMISTPTHKDQQTNTPATPNKTTAGQNNPTEQPTLLPTATTNSPLVFNNISGENQEHQNTIPFQSPLINQYAADGDNHFNPGTPVETQDAIFTIEQGIKTSVPVISAPGITTLASQEGNPLVFAGTINKPGGNTESKETPIAKTELQSLYYPLTIESVINSYRRSFVQKVYWQVYFAPTISYRVLSENKEFLRSAAVAGNVPNYAAYYVDLKNVVTHKPDIGLELGITAKYPISKSVYLRGGLQFNVSRYDIRAFSSPSEVATIALDGGPGNTSISRETTYRTRSGSTPDWLQNLYYSTSLPLGVEVNLSRKKKTSFSLAGTVQPTYVISDRAYLISTDYKNYVEVPGRILRRWNLNTGIEALVGYSTKKLQWQIGPQVRYQVRSSFQDLYPVNENLFDFGIKVGVMLNK